MAALKNSGWLLPFIGFLNKLYYVLINAMEKFLTSFLKSTTSQFMIVCAADTSPLIAFSGIHRLDILQSVFSEVLVAPAVFREIVTEGVGWVEAKAAQNALHRCEWLQPVTLAASPLLTALRESLGDSGEAEAIALSLERRMPVLLDELYGRKIAAKHGAQVVGSLGVLKEAKRLGLVAETKPLVKAMLENGIYYHASLLSVFFAEMAEV